MSIEEAAAQREAAWLVINGQHEYERHDLVADTAEELADAYNYVKAMPESRWRGYLLDYLRNAWGVLERLGGESRPSQKR